MRSIAALDRIQLQRLELAILVFTELAPNGHARKMHLFDARRCERNDLVHDHKRSR
jgi:hypothetical protein